MKRIVTTLALALAGLATTAAVAGASSFTPPPTPAWENRPCPTNYIGIKNCYWNREQMGGPVDFFTRKLPHQPLFCVFYSDRALAKKYDACYSTRD